MAKCRWTITKLLCISSIGAHKLGGRKPTHMCAATIKKHGSRQMPRHNCLPKIPCSTRDWLLQCLGNDMLQAEKITTQVYVCVGKCQREHSTVNSLGSDQWRRGTCLLLWTRYCLTNTGGFCLLCWWGNPHIAVTCMGVDCCCEWLVASIMLVLRGVKLYLGMWGAKMNTETCRKEKQFVFIYGTEINGENSVHRFF